MTSDNSIKSNLEYLDKILKCLINNASHYTLSFPELYKYLYKRDFESDNKFNANNHLLLVSDETEFFNIPVTDNQKALGEKLVEACYYLGKNGYVIIREGFNVSITFQGILKYSDGFANDYQKEQGKNKRLRQVERTAKIQGRWLVLLTLLVALGTLVSAWYYLTLIFCSKS